MVVQPVAIQQGIWIDEQHLRDAGLGSQIQVIVQPGEIRVVAVPTEDQVAESSDAAWDAFLALGQDAEAGTLPNPSVQHDRYLYGRHS